MTIEEAALLDAIANTESAGSWNVIYGGSKFNDYSKHPAKFVTIKSGPNKGEKSSAAGKYQITKTTYDRVAPKLGITDFTPESQQQIALYLAREKYGPNLAQDLADGKAADVAAKLAGVWTSLPGGIEAGTNSAKFSQAYAAALDNPRPPGSIPDLATSTDTGIRGLQQQLASRGFSPGAIDGIRGPKTDAAIRAFQQSRGLAVDGVIGPKTLAALSEQARPTTQRSDDAPFRPFAAPAPLTPSLNTRTVKTVPIDLETGNPFVTNASRTLGGNASGSVLGFRPTTAPTGPSRISTAFGADPLMQIMPTMTPQGIVVQAPDPFRSDPMIQATIKGIGGRGAVAPISPVIDPGHPDAFQVQKRLLDRWGYKDDAPIVTPRGTTAPTAPAGGFNFGNALGSLGTTLGAGLNTLGTKAVEVGTTLGTNAIKAKDAVIEAAPKVAEKAGQQAIENLMGTVGGRTLLFNTALGITPRKSAAEIRAANTPEGFGYGATGKKMYKIGGVYNSSRGQVVFDGSKFIPAGTQVRSSVNIPPRNATSALQARQDDYARRGLNEFGMLS